MIRNFLMVAFRNLWHNKLFSFINILGLTIGMTACLLILIYVHYERSYDRFHTRSNEIYRLRYERISETGEAVRFASCCPPAAVRMREQFPEVEIIARCFSRQATFTSDDEHKFIEDHNFFVEQEYFEIFDFEFISGDSKNGIREANTCYISESTAFKYFGNENPIGKTLSRDKQLNFKVTGVYKDFPENSHMQIDIAMSYPNLWDIYGRNIENSWGDSGFYTFFILKPGSELETLKIKLADLVEKEWGEVLRHYKLSCELIPQKLTDIHLHSHYQQELKVNGDVQTVNFLFMIALFIIIIAWVNYINLSTARSMTRAREVGLRKVVGADKTQLMGQFLIETFVLNLMALLLAVGLMEIIRPIFSEITAVPSDQILFNQSWFWLTMAVLFFAGIFLSGIYPIMVLSSFKPIHVLKGKLGNSIKGINLRKALVIFQMIMALILMSATFAVFRQISFMKNQSLGISLDDIVAVRTPRIRDEASIKTRMESFKEELIKDPNILKTSVVTEIPGRQIYWDAGGIMPAGSKDSKNYLIVGIDYDFVDLFEVQLVAGRNFSKDFVTDENQALIFNETAVKWMGFKDAESAIGERVDYWGNIYHIIGVFKDYHQQSPKQDFEQTIYRYMPTGRDVRGMIAIKINDQNRTQTIDQIQKLYMEFFPGNPFDYVFIESYYEQQYKPDKMFGTVFGIFAILAIFITTMGILGLTSFMIEQRTKEISIRNVLGANLSRILILIGKDFLYLILISFVIAVPICYWGLTSWLDTFSMRMNLGAAIFILPLLITLFIAGSTIWVLVYDAARKNPVDTLKYE